MTAISPVNFAASGSDAEALLLKMYSNSFVAAPRSGIFLFGGPSDRFIFRPPVQGMGGKSWQYLMMADVPAPEEFDPGSELLGQAMAIEEGTIVTDKYVMCHQWIGKDKMDQAHFRAQIIPQLGEKHRNQIERGYDKRAMITAALGARSTTAVTKNGLNVHNGGNRVTRTGGGSGTTLADAYPLSATGAANLRADLRLLGLRMTQDMIAPGPQNRGLILAPHLMTVLTYDNTAQVFSKDYVTTNDQQRHEVNVIENFAVIGQANLTSDGGPLPSENITDLQSKYNANFSCQAANGIPGVLAFTRSQDGEYGLGSATFDTLTHRVKYFEEKLAWLIFSYIRTGVDVMHPWCLGSVEAIA